MGSSLARTYRVGLVLVALLGAGCVQEPVVGVVRPVTGPDGAYGRAVDLGVDFAVEHASVAGDLPAGFRMVRVDTISDPELAAAEVHKLVTDQGVRIILGAVTSAEAEALLPVIEDEQVICLSPTASGDDLGRRSRYFYRLAPTDELEGRTAARHLRDERGIREVIIYTDDSRLTRDVEAEFRQYFEMKLGGTIVETIHLSTAKWHKYSADALLANDPEAAYVVGHAAKILEVLVDLEKNHFAGVRSTTSTFYLEDVLATAGPVADGVIFPLPTYDVVSDREPVHTFAEQFNQRYGQRPDIYAAQGFDAMHVALRSLLGAESLYTPELRKVLSYGLRDYLGVTGAIAFDEAGDVSRYPVMHCIRNGAVRPCSTLRQETKDRIRDFLGGLPNAV